MRGLRDCLLLLCLQGTCLALQCEVIPGKLAQIEAGNGQVFGATSAGQLFTLYGRTWPQVPGTAAYVTVGPAGVWCVTKARTIYKMVGGTWTLTTGLLKQIDAGGHQMVVGVTSDDDVYCLPRSAAVSADGRSPLPWVHIEGKLKHYSCGSLGCWGVNSTDYIFYRHGVTPECCAGSRWQQVPGRVALIEVGTDGSVYGLTYEGRIYRREGITACNPIGTRWVWLGIGNGHGKITHISYDLNFMWAVDITGKILKCQTQNVMQSQCLP